MVGGVQRQDTDVSNRQTLPHCAVAFGSPQKQTIKSFFYLIKQLNLFAEKSGKQKLKQTGMCLPSQMNRMHLKSCEPFFHCTFSGFRT